MFVTVIIPCRETDDPRKESHVPPKRAVAPFEAREVDKVMVLRQLGDGNTNGVSAVAPTPKGNSHTKDAAAAKAITSVQDILETQRPKDLKAWIHYRVRFRRVGWGGLSHFGRLPYILANA